MCKKRLQKQKKDKGKGARAGREQRKNFTEREKKKMIDTFSNKLCHKKSISQAWHTQKRGIHGPDASLDQQTADL